MGKKSAKKKSDANGANLSFEAKLWLAADRLRNNMDAPEYKHLADAMCGLVGIFAPYKGRIFDCCYGADGRFVQSANLISLSGAADFKNDVFPRLFFNRRSILSLVPAD